MVTFDTLLSTNVHDRYAHYISLSRVQIIRTVLCDKLLAAQSPQNILSIPINRLITLMPFIRLLLFLLIATAGAFVQFPTPRKRVALFGKKQPGTDVQVAITLGLIVATTTLPSLPALASETVPPSNVASIDKKIIFTRVFYAGCVLEWLYLTFKGPVGQDDNDSNEK